MSATGDVLEVGGVMAAPFTGGSSLEVSEIGIHLSLTGTGLQVAADFSEGKYEDALKKTLVAGITNALTKYLGKALANEIKASKYTTEAEAGQMKELIKAKVGQAATIIQNAVDVASDKKEKKDGH